MKWTDAQKKVIETRDKNILVSAAAGSGKTAVLVERIISRILDENNPASIDRMLVVTFTNAAAAEMRERILRAITKVAEQEPDNEYIQKQITYIHNAKISTIDSFCQSVVRDNFNKIDIDPSFRMANENELELIKQDVLEATLEEFFNEGDKDFLDFTEARGGKYFQKILSDNIMKLYKFSCSNPFPEKWLDECLEVYDNSHDFTENPWFECMESKIRKQLTTAMNCFEEALELCNEPNGPAKYISNITTEYETVKIAVSKDDYFEMAGIIQSIDFARIPTIYAKDNVDMELKEQAQSLRNRGKAIIEDVKTMCYSDRVTLEKELSENYKAVNVLVRLVKTFSDKFSAYKRERNIADFNDVAHMALKILTEADENGNVRPSEVAKELSDNYDEIMIDEYQDSNLIQEYLLTAVSGINSGRNNMFMVGDVKQSIYKFRMAKPELFLSKYNAFPVDGNSSDIRISLDKNFRSRREVIEEVNYIFDRIMGEDVGGINYDDEHSLKYGATYSDFNEHPLQNSEFILIEHDGKSSDALVTETNVISRRIKELIGKKFLVTDKATGEKRPVKYSDIAILTRALSGNAETISRILSENDIPSYVEKSTGFFDTLEVSTVLNMLSVIDNPHQDIPVTAVLKNMFMFTPEELAEIVLEKAGDIYNSLLSYIDNKDNAGKKLYDKAKKFESTVSSFRIRSKYESIRDIIEEIVEETGYGYYISTMNSGDRRTANIKMLISKAEEYENTSFTGLFNFIRYISNIKKYEVESGEASSVNENDDSVRIMTIHKSKGLEFPVVFVSFTGKQFIKNTDSIVIHEKYGIGMDYIDVSKRTRKSNCVKKIITEELKKDEYAEGLRVLYVALTRAKEKLIVTGTGKYDKLTEKAQGCHIKADGKLSENDILSCNSYLEWIAMSVAERIEQDAFTVVNGEEFTISGRVLENMYADYIEEELGRENIHILAKSKEFEKYNPCVYFEKKYKYDDDTKLNSKYSVSEIKKMIYEEGVDDDDEEQMQLYSATHKKESYVPSFIKESEELKGAGRGTAYHRVFELLDYRDDLTKEGIEKQINSMVRDGYIDEMSASVVSPLKIYEFTTTEIGKRMKKAELSDCLFREQQYVMGVKASEIHTNYNGDEMVLVQGAIDAYFVENGKVIIVDYKTDNVTEPEQLLTLYKGQLDYYAKAITEVTGMEVTEKIIYSVKFGKEVPV